MTNRPDKSAFGSLPLAAAMAGLILAALASGVAGATAAPRFPFGGHQQPYAAGVLSPSVSQKKQDRQTAAYYAEWKTRYLKAGCKAGHYYVKADTFSGATVVSEGQGYGMLIVAMMAGEDPDAQALFDGLLRYYLDHPSGIDPVLMSWAQDENCQNMFSNDSATDGDLDAAYALLLAHKQWGSAGEFNYLAAAKRVMAGLRRSNVTAATKLTNLGDWVTVGSAKYTFASRSSDWMPGHFRAFAKLNAAKWKPVLKASQKTAEGLQSAFASKTGLLPDFVVETDASPRPAPKKFLEADTDGWYSYNACRDPWRFGVDAAISGDAASKRVARRISQWARKATGGRPARLRDGYRLNGKATVEYQTMTFVAPFAVAATVDPGAQAWLDALWDAMVAAPPDGYYPDSIKLLSMLAVSRNWLTP